MADKDHKDDSGETNIEALLDDLYSLQDSLLENRTKKTVDLPKTATPEELESLEIPILTDVVDQAVSSVKQQLAAQSESQQGLFDEGISTEASSALDDQQIQQVVDKLMQKLKPKLEKLLRDRLLAKVRARMATDK